MEKARLEEEYIKNIRSALKKELNIDNIMAVPKIQKIVLNAGVKDAVSDSKALQSVQKMLEKISGQKTIRRQAKKSIAGFKLREGMSIGAKVTLRRKKMYEFLDRLINLALPRVRDFQGVSTKLDRRGNYNLGIKDLSVFPEITFDEAGKKTRGINITIQMSTDNDDHARSLLEKFSMPFAKSNEGK